MLASLTYTRQLKQTILGKKRPRRSLLKGGEKFAGIPSKFFNIPRPRARISIPAYRPCSHTCIHGVASRASAINHSAVRIELTKSAKMERPEGPKPEAVSASADSDAGISNGARLPLKFPRLDSSRAYQGKRPGDDTRRDASRRCATRSSRFPFHALGSSFLRLLGNKDSRNSSRRARRLSVCVCVCVCVYVRERERESSWFRSESLGEALRL
jgi:hypothetical protein